MLFQLLWHLLSVFAMRFGNIWTLLMASKGPFVVLTLDFVVAISALRISGSYLELDEEPESTGTNTAVSSAALPSSLHLHQPHQIEVSHPSCTPRHPHVAGLLPNFHISLLRDRESQQGSQVLHKKYRLKGPKHVLHLQSLGLFQVNTLNSNSQTRSLYSVVWLPAFPEAFNRTEGTGFAWRFT